MKVFELRTLGEYAFSYAGEVLPAPPTKKARALLAYLVMHRSADVSREALLERFWPDFDPERARDNLKVSLWSVRRTIRAANVEPGEVLRADRTLVRWLGPVDFDVDRFAALCASRVEKGSAAEALSIYRGEFLEGDFDEWATTQRERFAAQYEALLSRSVAVSKDVAASETLIGRNPYDEAAYATLIEAELGAGRPQAAALIAERCRSALAEMGAEPSHDFERRFGSLRRPESASREFRLPFVARDAELGELGRRLSEAADGSGSITVVHGDAGIGKSSVLAQAERIAVQRGLRPVELQCKGRETQTLGEWREIYEATTGGSLSEVVASAGSSAAATVAREFAEELAASSSALFVDDAQHLSGESFAVLVELARYAADSTALVIASRPEGVARLRTSLHERRNFSEARLDCLSDTDLTSALRQGSGNDLPDLARAVFERTKGHPLYIVETLSALVENGTLSRGEHGWMLRSALDESLPVPTSMRTFIEGRLTARGSVPATVASALALEPAASASELGSVLAMDETTLLDALDDLLALGLIVPAQAGAQFAFSHDLVQEAAAAMLNAGRRVRLHAAFARDLQRSNDRNAAIRRARHLLAADKPLDAAADFLRAAGGAQVARLPQDALRRAREGIEALERVDDSAERVALLASLHRVIAQASFALLELDGAVAAGETAVTLARARGDQSELAGALILRARIADAVRTPVERVALAREALETARKANDRGLVSKALVELAAASRESGERCRAVGNGAARGCRIDPHLRDVVGFLRGAALGIALRRSDIARGRRRRSRASYRERAPLVSARASGRGGERAAPRCA
jgi:DNA-binding SARP family transcriptional activator/tetratricopeptide (TPR) repeat protein